MSDILISNNTLSNKSIRCFKQVTKLNRFGNCMLEGNISNINSLSISFDECVSVVPSKLEFYDGKCVATYTDVKLVKIIDDSKLNNTYDSENVLLLYYNDPYVLNNYRNLIKSSKTTKSLVGRYIVDWKFNNRLINELIRNNSIYIELNYYAYN